VSDAAADTHFAPFPTSVLDFSALQFPVILNFKGTNPEAIDF